MVPVNACSMQRYFMTVRSLLEQTWGARVPGSEWVLGSNQVDNNVWKCLFPFAGELGALEEVVGQLVTRGLLKPMTLKALWLICSNAFDRLSSVSHWPVVCVAMYRRVHARQTELAVMLTQFVIQCNNRMWCHGAL